MAAIQKEHYFYEGRNGCKTGKTGPGILVVEGKYKFRVNQYNKAKTIYKMYCVQQGNPEFACKAKATVVRRNDDSFFLYSCDIVHNHFTTTSEIIAEELKQRMAELVKKDPVAPVGEAIRAVKLQAAEEYAEDEDLFNEIVSSLGTFHGMELRLFRVRNSIIGPNPKSRNHFDPNYFLRRIYGDDHKVVVLDSNKLPDDWQEVINKSNPNSKYYWDKLNDNMRNYEDQEEDSNEEDVQEDTNVDGDEEVDTDHTENVTIEDIGPEEYIEDGPENPPPPSKNLPKRILAYTSKQLLQLFGKCTRGSLDGTFKSCCKLWKQQFVYMLKYNKHWIPVVWGWLPDKCEVSYKVFLHMVLEKLRELNIPFNLEEIITDFELNIHKSIDDMMPDIDILGCFFHLAKAFKKKVDIKHMKMHYENNDKFRKFIKQAIALSSLPLDDLQLGVQWLKDNVIFDDEKENVFKREFIQYIEDYWINGCFPPFVWSTWSRTDDYTNNNQEGYNSRMNKELKQIHPSPGILLSFIRKQIILSQHRIAESKVAKPKPRKLKKHKTMADTRSDLKVNYQKARKMRNVNVAELVGEYLSIMGHNVISATMVGRLTDVQESQSTSDPNENEDENNVSSWLIHENSVLDDVFECENPYIGRKVGVSKRVQEEQEIRATQWWRGAVCPSCKKGFNSRSSRKQCHGCDKSTHNKNYCVSMADDSTVFLCKSCKPSTDIIQVAAKSIDGFVCKSCDFKTSFKYNLQRHMQNKHAGIDEDWQGEQISEVDESPKDRNEIDERESNSQHDHLEYSVRQMLKEMNLENLLANFESQGVDMKMLISFDDAAMKECMKEIGINRFGDRHRIVERVLVERRNPRKHNLMESCVGENVLEEYDTNLNDVSVVEEESCREISQANAGENMLEESDTNLNDVSVVEENPETRGNDVDEENLLEESDPNLNDVTFAEEEPGQKNCKLCNISQQHFCTKCKLPVCNLFCSIQDPSSTNEMHRIHKPGDIRCISQCFECPTCEESFSNSSSLQNHISKEHVQETSRSMISEANSSSWMHVPCPQCSKRFENDGDINYHLVRVHEYGEECALYPCEECGYSGQDLDSLKVHRLEHNENASIKDASCFSDLIEDTSISRAYYQDTNETSIQHTAAVLTVQRRIVQTLKDVVFDEDSDDDMEYTPADEGPLEDEHLFDCALCEFKTKYPNNLDRHVKVHDKNKKRKQTSSRDDSPQKKKSKSSDNEDSWTCGECGMCFSRKGNLKRHSVNKHGA